MGIISLASGSSCWRGLDYYKNKPIIRKGITSTHLKFDYNGKKEFLIDMNICRSFTLRKAKKYECYHCTSYVRNGSCTSNSIRKDI